MQGRGAPRAGVVNGGPSGNRHAAGGREEAQSQRAAFSAETAATVPALASRLPRRSWLLCCLVFTVRLYTALLCCRSQLTVLILAVHPVVAALQ